MNLPIRQTPYTVNQVDSELMEDRGDTTVYDALENIAGVTHQSTNSDTGSNFVRSIFVRGFDIAGDGPILVNGQRFYTTGTNFRSTASMERIDLLRGAAGIYYGASQPGGVLNYVYKKPQAEAAQKVSVRGDSFGSYGGTADITGAVSEDESLRVRLIADYGREKDNVEEIYEEPKSLMGALQWVPSEEFESTFTVEALDIDGVPQRYDNIRVNGELLPIQEDIFWGHDNDFVDVKQYTAMLENNWTPSDAFNVRTYLAYQTTDQEHQTTRIGGRGGGAPLADTSLPRTVHVGQSEEYSISTGFDLSGRFDTGDFGHDWLFGYGFAYGESEGGVAQCSTGANAGSDCFPIRPTSQFPFDPVQGDYAYQSDIFDLIGTQRGGVGFSEARDHNFYVQDMVTLPNEDTKLLAGVGYTIAERESWDEPKGGTRTPTQMIDAARPTPRLALIHDLDRVTTVYASYNESYFPQLYSNPDGGILDDPEIGVQYEAGFKRDMFDGDALFTLSLFQLEKENVQRNDPAYDPSLGYRISDGLQRSRGLETELSGRVNDWWKAHLGYAYLATEIVDADANVGQDFENVSRHNLSLWNKFRVLGDRRSGEFSIGAGLSAHSRSGTFSGAENPGYGIVDVGLFYEQDVEDGPALNAALRVDNLLDKDYFDRRSYGSSVTYGEERVVSFRLGARF
nr:TonB-dependent receptor [Marivibrio halodurans]